MRAPNRRQFLQAGLALGGVGALSACGIPLTPARPRLSRIGFIDVASGSDQPSRWIDAFRDGLRQAGYVEGQNVAVDYRWSPGEEEQLSALVAELVREHVDVMVTATSGVTQAVQRATSTIPIVMVRVGDPIGVGIVARLARPGGNVTGLSGLGPELAPKRLQLLRESAPWIARIGVLYSEQGPGRLLAFQETESAARTLGLPVLPLGVNLGDDLAAIVADAVGQGVDALIVQQGNGVRDNHGVTVVDLAAKHRLPAMYDADEFIEPGGLMFYGVDFADLYRRAATYVDKILKGAQPADLPIERPTRFDFVVNLKTARDLGLTIPPSVLAQATEVIQ